MAARAVAALALARPPPVRPGTTAPSPPFALAVDLLVLNCGLDRRAACLVCLAVRAVRGGARTRALGLAQSRAGRGGGWSAG